MLRMSVAKCDGIILVQVFPSGGLVAQVLDIIMCHLSNRFIPFVMALDIEYMASIIQIDLSNRVVAEMLLYQFLCQL